MRTLQNRAARPSGPAAAGGQAGVSPVTADPFAGTAGLVSRSAAAYASSIPEHPADEGFFGPGSVAWRVSAGLSTPVAGLRALLMQALHPLAMAGVDQHSDWRQDPVGRLAATGAYLATVTFGDRVSAERAAARVRRIHEHVRGVDTVTGRPYAAGDPALLLWVHATFVHSGIVAAGLFGTPLPVPDADRFVAEMVSEAELVGVPRDRSPPAWPLSRPTSSRPAPSCAARPRPGSPWITCSIRPGWTRTSRRSGGTCGMPPWARCPPGHARCTGTTRRR